jgi:very-short-patch-repair endonuclease
MGRGKKKQVSKGLKRFMRVLDVKMDMYLRNRSLINAETKMPRDERIKMLAECNGLEVKGKPDEWLQRLYNSGLVREFTEMGQVYGKCTDKALLAKRTAEKMVIGEVYKQELRVKATSSEIIFKNILWKIKKDYLPKLSFDFQKSWYAGVGFYISDFYFPKTYSTIEIDGGYHDTVERQEKDRKKEVYLLKRGIKTFRLTNDQVKHMSIEVAVNFLVNNKIIII